MSTALDQKIDEFARWYNYHWPTLETSNLKKRVDFQDVVIKNLFKLLDQVSEDLRSAENRPRSDLWLPNGVRINGSVREFN